MLFSPREGYHFMSTISLAHQLQSEQLSHMVLRAMATQTLPKLRNERDLLLYLLIEMGWAQMSDIEDVIFVKHIYPKTDQKRSIMQLIISPALGTGLYHFRRTVYTYRIEEYLGSLKLTIADLDAFPVSRDQTDANYPEEAIFATDNDLGMEGLIQYLLSEKWITPEEVIFFTMDPKERKELSKLLPVLYLECGAL